MCNMEVEKIPTLMKNINNWKQIIWALISLCATFKYIKHTHFCLYCAITKYQFLKKSISNFNYTDANRNSVIQVDKRCWITWWTSAVGGWKNFCLYFIEFWKSVLALLVLLKIADIQVSSTQSHKKTYLTRFINPREGSVLELCSHICLARQPLNRLSELLSRTFLIKTFIKKLRQIELILSALFNISQGNIIMKNLC